MGDRRNFTAANLVRDENKALARIMRRFLAGYRADSPPFVGENLIELNGRMEVTDEEADLITRLVTEADE
jgi:hypothetical protein